MPLPTGVLLTCHKIMTVTPPSSPATSGLLESKELLPASGEMACRYPVVSFSDLLCSPVPLTMYPEQHFWDSFITSPLLPASQHSAVSQGHFRFVRQPSLTHRVWVPRGHELILVVPTSVSPQAVGWIHHRKGGEEKKMFQTWDPLERCGGRKSKGLQSARSHMPSAGQVSGAQGFLEGKGAGNWWILLWKRGKNPLPFTHYTRAIKLQKLLAKAG